MAKPELLVHANHMPQMSQCCSLPVRQDVLFTDKNGAEKPRLRKRAEQILGKLNEPLTRVLRPGEVILHCVQAQSPMSALEQFFVGWMAYVLRRSMLVITNQRILQFSVSSSNKWTRRLRAIAWGDIQQAKASGLISGQLVLKYRNGKKEKFWGIGSGEVGKLKTIVNAVLPDSTTEQTSAQAPVSLCPDCYKPLTPGLYLCESCGLVFKNEKTLVLMGVFVPGGAYFYTGFPFLGTITALFESLLILEIIGMTIGLIQTKNPQESADYVAALVYVGILLAIETLVTIGHCRALIRGFIPTGKKQQPQLLVSSSASASKGF